MTTFAPAAMHACACAFCFSGSFRALLIDAETPAFAKAAFIAGASNCTQRTDDLVSGRSTQTSTFAPVCFVLAVAVATTTPAAIRASVPRITAVLPGNFLNSLPPLVRGRGVAALRSYSPCERNGRLGT